MENMDIQEYEELFGKCEVYDDELIDDNCMISYATKEECEKIIRKYKKKEPKIPKRCKICVNCMHFSTYWYECDSYDCYCENNKNTWSRNKFGYREVEEYDSCDEWEWNRFQLVDPRTYTTLNTDLYK